MCGLQAAAFPSNPGQDGTSLDAASDTSLPLCMQGVIMSITITTIAACETAIGLALCVTYFHIRSATDVEALNLLK